MAKSTEGGFDRIGRAISRISRRRNAGALGALYEQHAAEQNENFRTVKERFELQQKAILEKFSGELFAHLRDRVSKSPQGEIDLTEILPELKSFWNELRQFCRAERRYSFRTAMAWSVVLDGEAVLAELAKKTGTNLAELSWAYNFGGSLSWEQADHDLDENAQSPSQDGPEKF